MNSSDRKPDYKKIYNEVKSRFDRTCHFRHGPFDETYFTMRVYESSKEIIRKLGKKIRAEQVLAASILHDIGKIKLKASKIFGRYGLRETAEEEWHRHAKLGVPIAGRILKKLGHSREFIDGVCSLIEGHDLRSKGKKSVELKILQDADLVADIGVIGFVRPFMYCGKFSRFSVISSIRHVQKKDRIRKGRLNLAVSRAIAKREITIQKSLAKEFLKDLDSDLL